jgi:hypothetical protein
MVFLIVAPSDPISMTLFILHYVDQEAFLQLCAFLAQWFLRWFLNDPTLYLHVCDYLPFKEDLALYLN